jgi:pSer/pThr/pTyr-binding forkhead associated (FHA) protein
MISNHKEIYGELKPIGGGDIIPLLKTTLVVGRRESCDIVLRFPNVSGIHCELSVIDGRWMIRDLNSSNGTKVNDIKIQESLIDPGDIISISKHKYEVCYNTGIISSPIPTRDIFSQSLLEAAGLETRPRQIFN